MQAIAEQSPATHRCGAQVPEGCDGRSRGQGVDRQRDDSLHDRAVSSDGEESLVQRVCDCHRINPAQVKEGSGVYSRRRRNLEAAHRYGTRKYCREPHDVLVKPKECSHLGLEVIKIVGRIREHKEGPEGHSDFGGSRQRHGRWP